MASNYTFEGEYDMALSIKDSTCNEYMLIAHFKSLNSDVYQNIIRDDTGAVPNRGILIGEALLGPNYDIPVWKIAFENCTQFSNQKILDLWIKYNVEQNRVQESTEPFFHILKTSESEREIGNVIEFDYLYLKRSGEYDPIYKASLKPNKVFL